MIALTKLRAMWNEYLFAMGTASRLGLFRWTLFLTALAFSRITLYRHDEIASVFYLPGFLFRIFSVPWMPGERLELLRTILGIFLFFSAVGFCYRIFAPLSLVAGLFFWGFRYNFGFYHHPESPLLLVMALATFSPAADSLSVDALLQRKLRWWLFAKPTEAYQGYYSWPIQAAKLLLVFILFSSGLWKLRAHGLLWLKQDMVGNIWFYGKDFYDFYASGFGETGTAIRTWMLSQPGLTRVGSAAVVVLELASPLAFVSTGLKHTFLPLWLAGVVLVQVTMGHYFAITLFPLLFAWYLPSGPIGEKGT